MAKIQAKAAYFIKLGVGGDWEKECFADGSIRFGYLETPHELCLSGDWKAVWDLWFSKRPNGGTATRDVKQIRAFYESGEDTIFITFADGMLHWCRPSGPVEQPNDQTRKRGTVGGWSSRSVGGKPLTKDRLSGRLLVVEGFRGTICQVSAFDYLMRKLNDELLPEVAAAEEAELALIEAIVHMMRLLTWKDFELLVDLVFSTSGWRRVSAIGSTQKTIDLELVLPTTSERAFVQVKSRADDASLRDYMQRLEAAAIYDRMFFVWHTGEISVQEDVRGVTMIGPQALGRMVLDAGLSSWLREKVS